MSFFKYCFYRMYKAYETKNDSPFLRSLIYISILKLSVFVVLYIYLKEVILRLFNIHEFNIERPLYVWSIAGIILIINYLFYSRVNVNEVEWEFENRVKLNRSIRLWMLIALPLVILFGGTIMYVFIFGGVILNKQIEGLF
jgi:hypothetical protein